MEIIEKIRKEIERRKAELDEQIGDVWDSKSALRIDELNKVLTFLDSLEAEECPKYCVRSHCIGCSKYNPDKWSNKPIKAKVKATGEIVEGFTDGQGHFDVFTDHNVCTRYDINAVEFDTLEAKEKSPMEILAEKCPQEEIDPKIAQCIADHWWEMAGEEKETPELEDEISRTYHDGSVADTSDIDHNTYENIARHFAQWGAEHFRDSTKMIDKSLEESAEKFAHSYGHGTCDGVAQDAFIAGAKWQKEQMEERWLKDRDGCFWDGVEEGKKAMREQMMKKAVEGTVSTDGYLLLDSGEVIDLCPKLGNIAFGLKPQDKVKLIIVKEQ